MENFILWAPSTSVERQRVSFFATQVNLQGIGKGTREMIAKFLEDLDLQANSLDSWTIDHHFVTDYLTRDVDSSEWEDSWSHTWEITVALTLPVDLKGEAHETWRSAAYDESWDGEPGWPAAPLIVVDFSGAELFDRAKEILERSARIRDEPTVLPTVAADVPAARPGLFAELVPAASEPGVLQQSGPLWVVRELGSGRSQLAISLGPCDEQFFAGGANFARLCRELCEALGGTTSFDESR